MTRQYWIVTFLLFFSAPLWAKKSVTLNISTKGYPPYLLIDKPLGKQGIMIDVFQKVMKQLDYKVELVSVRRKRVDHYIKTGKLDATPRAVEWTKNPNDFIFTEPVLLAKDVLFVQKDSTIVYKDLEDLKGKVIGARTGYRYPHFKESFEKNLIVRKDDASEETMLRRLKTNQVHASILNELVGLWVIKNHHWDKEFKTLPKHVGEFEYRFMFAKSNQKLVNSFNQVLNKLKAQGVVDKSIQQYTK